MNIGLFLRRVVFLAALSLLAACVLVTVGQTDAGVAALMFVGVGCVLIAGLGIFGGDL